MKTKVSDLQLRDVVQTFESAYSFATVVKIDTTKRVVLLFRPYTVCENYSIGSHMSPSVLHSIGFEQYEFPFTAEVKLIDRPNDREQIK